jgi:hypothetical protein
MNAIEYLQVSAGGDNGLTPSAEIDGVFSEIGGVLAVQ